MKLTSPSKGVGLDRLVKYHSRPGFLATLRRGAPMTGVLVFLGADPAPKSVNESCVGFSRRGCRESAVDGKRPPLASLA